MRPSEKLPAVYKHELKSVVLVGKSRGTPPVLWGELHGGMVCPGEGPGTVGLLFPRKEQKL